MTCYSAWGTRLAVAVHNNSGWQQVGHADARRVADELMRDCFKGRQHALGTDSGAVTMRRSPALLSRATSARKCKWGGGESEET